MANQVIIPPYIQGMIFLNTIPDEWDHVAAHYIQQTNAVANVTFMAICTAILAEHDQQGGTRQNQTHIADKISAVKRKGKNPQFYKRGVLTHTIQLLTRLDPSIPRGQGGIILGKKSPGEGSNYHSHFANIANSAELSMLLLACMVAQNMQPMVSLNRQIRSLADRISSEQQMVI